jgi:hypothetical protein
MRNMILPIALATGLLCGPSVGALAAATEAQPQSQADVGYGARSLRGLKEAYVEVVDEATGAADDKDSGDDVAKLLKDLMKSDSSGSRADKLKADVVAVLTSRTAITPRFNSVDEARAAGAPVLSVRLTSRGAGSGGKAPYDVTLSLRQQVALSRDPTLTFYATTYDMTVTEPADGRGKRKVVAAVMDKFVELWRAAN